MGSTEIFDLIDGVTFTEVGYANGNILDPTDEDIVVEVCPLENYYEAKEYHQKYLDKNPSGYCHIPQVKYDSINIKPMSEYEKFLRKEYHVPFDPYLRSLRKKTNELLNKLNNTDKEYRSVKSCLEALERD